MARLGQGVSPRPFGVNLAGYLQSEKGMGEASRAVVRALEAASIPYVLNNVVDSLSHNMDQSVRRFSADNPYLVNIVQVNADQVQEFVRSRPAYMDGHYNIGYWNWELASFPDEWRGSCRCFDEIWVPSGFTLDSVAAVSPVPVRMVPFAITVPQSLPEGVERSRFDLPEDAFVFLFAFDFQSYMARKNPLGVIETRCTPCLCLATPSFPCIARKASACRYAKPWPWASR
jgi:hypothetical protein